MFTGISRYLFSFVLIVALSACQPAPDTAAPASPSPEPPSPTSTPAPTQEQVTPIPTANFLLEDILGIWTRSDPERGDLFIIINSDGSYNASHGSPDSIVHAGAYTLEGRIFTFVDGWDCSPEETTPGQYILRLSGGKYLLFEPYNDTCPDRPSAFKSYRWDRVEPTPTP